jgi:GAF domain-containing protein
MYDQRLFLQTLSRFAVVLPARYDLEAALSELTVSVIAVLGLCGSGVSMAEDGRLRFVTAVSQASGELERSQQEQQAGRCRDAYQSGEVIRVMDVRQESTRWPEFSAIATRLSVAGVAGIPMRLDDQIIGALNLYSPEPREWSDVDIAVATVLADVATSYVVNASKLRQQSS